MARPIESNPEFYRRGGRGQPEVTFTAPMIRFLLARGLVKQIRAAVTGVDPVLDAQAVALALAAQEVGVSGVGRIQAPIPETTAESGKLLTTRQAADRLGRTTRAVTGMCAAGRMGRKDTRGNWWISEDELRNVERN